MAVGSLSNRNEDQRYLLGVWGKCDRWEGLTTLQLSCTFSLGILGAPNTRSPKGFLQAIISVYFAQIQGEILNIGAEYCGSSFWNLLCGTVFAPRLLRSLLFFLIVKILSYAARLSNVQNYLRIRE